MHTDAVQAVGHVPVDFGPPGFDLLSLSGHKVGAPAASGPSSPGGRPRSSPVAHGGGQERGIRSGTANVPGAAALAAHSRSPLPTSTGSRPTPPAPRRPPRRARAIDGVHPTGTGLPEDRRHPGIAHAIIDGVDADSLLFTLDRAGIAASAGSACRAGVHEPSHVALAMGWGAEHARGTLRCSMGWDTTAADVSAFAAVVGDAVGRARRAHRS